MRFGSFGVEEVLFNLILFSLVAKQNQALSNCRSNSFYSIQCEEVFERIDPFGIRPLLPYSLKKKCRWNLANEHLLCDGGLADMQSRETTLKVSCLETVTLTTARTFRRWFARYPGRMRELYASAYHSVAVDGTVAHTTPKHFTAVVSKYRFTDPLYTTYVCGLGQSR